MWAYVILTFALSWGWAAVAHNLGLVKLPFQEGDSFIYPFILIFMCGPALAALILAAIQGRIKEKLRFRLTPNAWWILAYLVPGAMIGAAWWMSLKIPGAHYLPYEVESAKLAQSYTGKALDYPLDQLLPLLLMQTFLIAPLLNTIGTLTEELGWRGYMLTSLGGRSFWDRHFTIGFFWGVWHAPVIAAGYNYPGEPILGPVVFTIFCMLMAPVIGLISERGRSVLAAGLFHGTVNAVSPAAVLTIGGLAVFERSIVGWPGLVVMALACALIWLLRLDHD